MAAKRIDLQKAKEAKQRKIAIVLGVLLVGVLVFQGPRTLKMLKGPEATTAAAPAPPAAAPPAGTPTTTPPVSAATPGLPPTAAQPAVLVDSDLPPAANDSQLLSFEQFQTKDPFAQQVEMGEAAPTEATGSTEAGSAPDATSRGGPNVEPGLDPLGSNPQDQDPTAEAPSFTAPDASAGDKPDQPEPAAATTIAVNGTVETVATKAEFPAEEPVFQLASLSRDGKSVRIAVAGGSYANGEQTIKLELGKRLTLQNTADGSRYELKLLTVEGFAPPNTTK